MRSVEYSIHIAGGRTNTGSLSVDRYHGFGGSCCLHLQCRRVRWTCNKYRDRGHWSKPLLTIRRNLLLRLQCCRIGRTWKNCLSLNLGKGRTNSRALSLGRSENLSSRIAILHGVTSADFNEPELHTLLVYDWGSMVPKHWGTSVTSHRVVSW